MKPNDPKFENKIAWFAWVCIAVLGISGLVFHWGLSNHKTLFESQGVLLLFLYCFLIWRMILWRLRKKAERQRVIAYWEKPNSRENMHIVRDVMDS